MQNQLGTPQEKLVSAPVLVVQRSKSHLTLDADTFDKQKGRALTNEKPDWTKRPLSDWSRALIRAEKN